MSKFLKALAVVVIVWLVLFLVQEGFTSWLPSAFDINLGFNQATRDETLNHGAADLKSISVETHNGSVTLHGRDDGEIEIQAHYTSRASSTTRARELVETFTTDLSVASGQLLVKANFATTSYNNQSVSYEIYLPKHLNVTVQTSNGSITVDDLAAEADLTSSNGAISVVSATGMDDVRIRTSNGRIEVSVPSGMSQLTAESSNGRIEIDGNPAEGGHWQLRTSNGGIHVSLPRALGVRLDASTSNSSIEVGEGPWSVNGGKLSNKEVRATRGDGTLDLLVHTSNASIEIIDR